MSKKTIIKTKPNNYIVMSTNNKPIEVTVEKTDNTVKTAPIVESKIPEETPVDTVTQTPTPIIKDYNQIMLENFIQRPQIYKFINQYLKNQYPDKFTDVNVQSTLSYLINYFSSDKNIYTSDLYNTFTW